MAGQLNVGKVTLGAFLVPWLNRGAFSRALSIPIMLLMALTLSWYYAAERLPGLAKWLPYVVYGALFAMFAVTCHRLVLLDPQAVASRIAPRWSWRETRFFMWMVLVWAVFLGTVWGLSMLMLNTWVAWVEVPERAWFDWTVLAAKVPAFYLVARISPVFPATAIDRKVDIRWAWRLTANNGWRLVLLVAVLPWVISHAVGLLYRGDPSVLETVVLTFVACALFAVEVAAISLAYRELTKGKDLTPG